MLNKKRGILGITKLFTDRRDVVNAAAQGNARASLAVEIEGYRVNKYVGAYFAAVGGVDAVVLTAGVGERSPHIRQAALSGLEGLGIGLDERRNALSVTRNAKTVISTDDSPVKVFVIPTDEELVMTEDTPSPENRVRVNRDGRIQVSWQRTNYDRHALLLGKAKRMLKEAANWGRTISCCR